MYRTLLPLAIGIAGGFAWVASSVTAAPSGDREASVATTGNPTDPIVTVAHVEIPMTSMEHLVSLSEDVILGRVLAREARFPDGGWPYTAYRVQVDEAWLGRVEGPLEIRVGGAVRDDGSGFVVHEAPSFEPGDEVVLTIGPNDGGSTHHIIALSNGTYRVTRDEAGTATVGGPYVAEGTPLGNLRDRVQVAATAGEVSDD